MPSLTMRRNSAPKVSCVQPQSTLCGEPGRQAHSCRLQALVPLAATALVVVRELRRVSLVAVIIQNLRPAESGRRVPEDFWGIPLGRHIGFASLLQALDELLSFFEDLLSHISLDRHHLLRKGACRLDSCMLHMCHLSLYFN